VTALPRILVAESDGFPAEAFARLSQAGNVILADLDRAGLREALKDADVLWVRLRHRIDSALLDAAPKLSMLVTPTTGLNHIDTDALRLRGIRLVSLRGEVEFLKDVRATAEHTLGLMLALIRHIPQAAADVEAGFWRRDRFRGGELYGKTVGVVGYGRLGRIVTRYLQAFDAQVLVSDPKLPAGDHEGAARAVTLPHLLENSDLVTLHVDLREETRGFFGGRSFQRMKPGSYFINTARGELIDEIALLEGLSSGRIAGAALDVLCQEDSAGMADHPLVQYARQHDNLLITPHLGGCTAESKRKTELFLAEKVFGMLLECREDLALVTAL
jgi:D-3-phosphoglycerate dehydrogenase